MGWACDRNWFSPWLGHVIESLGMPANLFSPWVEHMIGSGLAQRLVMWLISLSPWVGHVIESGLAHGLGVWWNLG